MSVNDKPLYSDSWDEPALVDSNDGIKTEFYERDLNPEGVKVLGKLIQNIRNQQSKSQVFEQAKGIVDHVLALQENQVLLLEKLYATNKGRKVDNIIAANANLDVVANMKPSKQES